MSEDSCPKDVFSTLDPGGEEGWAFFDSAAIQRLAPGTDPVSAPILAAFVRFFSGNVQGARTLAEASYREGDRHPLLIDLLTRCQVDCGEVEGALRLLHDNPAALSAHPSLFGRAAALCFICGLKEQADLLAKRVCALSGAVVGDRGVAEKEARIRYMRMTEEERMQIREGYLPDYYRFADSQAGGWKQYAGEFNPTWPRQRNGTMFLAHLIQESLGGLERPFNLLIDFGCLYGGLDDWLAFQYPAAKIVGYDRSSIAIDLNRTHFSRPNLAFETGPIDEVLRPYFEDATESVLVHARTACLMYPDQLRRFYCQCVELGVSCIIAIEPWSYSEFTEEFVDFRRTGDRTVGLGGPMMIHDYHSYLAEAGYEVGQHRVVYQTCYDEKPHPRNFAYMAEIVVAGRSGQGSCRESMLPGMPFPVVAG